MGFDGDVAAGLTGRPKSIPPRWFYDSLGSALFGAICELPEYYLTRAETEILTTNAEAITAALGNPAQLVELGSGSSAKTRILLSRLAGVEYVPVDLDAALLESTARLLRTEYAQITVTPVTADFQHPSRAAAARRGRRAILFLGSTIGNLSRPEAVAMLRDARRVLERGEAMVIGADLRKERETIEAAYDDALGVTAAFNLNLLQRINRELGGRFDLASFAHRAFYDEAKGRVEMHLVSLRRQSVPIEALAMNVAFEEGETIHTENSYKYDEATMAGMATEAGFELSGRWTDAAGRFADFLLTAAE
jgi:dimethylhistidine N-methyltransferase